MKKLITLSVFILLAVAMIAQERTVTITLPTGVYYYKYTGTASDVLIPTTTDTIDIIFIYQSPEYVKKVALKTRYDMRVLADTTVACVLAGKEFSDHATYTDVIASAVSSAVTANNVVHVQTLDPYIIEAAYMTDVGANDSTNVAHNHTPFDIAYRYYRARYILQGNDATGTGVKIDEVEIKFYVE